MTVTPQCQHIAKKKQNHSIYAVSCLINKSLHLAYFNLPTFSESNEWHFCLVITWIYENTPATSHDFLKTSEHCRKRSKMFRQPLSTSKALKDDNFSVFWFPYDAKSSFNTFLEYFCGNWIEFSLYIMCWRTISPDLWVRGEKLSSMSEINVLRL